MRLGMLPTPIGGEAGGGQTVLLVSVHLSKAGPYKLEWSANDQLQTLQYLDNGPVDVSAKRIPHSWKVHAPWGIWTAALTLDGMAPSKITSFFKPDQSPRTRDNVASPKNLAALSTHNKGKFAIENGRGRPGVLKLYKRSPENNRNLSHDGALSHQACTHGGLESEGQRRTSEEAGTQDDRSVMHLGRRSALEAILPACCNFWMTAGQPKKPTLHVAHPPSVRPGADGAPAPRGHTHRSPTGPSCHPPHWRPAVMGEEEGAPVAPMGLAAFRAAGARGDPKLTGRRRRCPSGGGGAYGWVVAPFHHMRSPAAATRRVSPHTSPPPT